MDKSNDLFGPVPWLALPTVFLVIVAVGIIFVAKTQNSSVPTPTVVPTEAIQAGCEVIERTLLYIIFKCPLGSYGPR